ncbi:MAG: cytochrome P450, C-22 desaturase [Monoraphidium minutum]|nr:MAG: cytochrome P450, C-22 desaturase [Monoraphidium minutum]
MPSTLPPAGSVLVWSVAAICLLALLEQVKYRVGRNGRNGALPGPSATLPFLGGIVDMVKDPHDFWEKQRAYACPGLSWNSIVTKFTVMVTDPAVIRHVFNHNSKETLLLDLHPNAKMILGTRNIAFMHGPEHKALRKSFLALFTRKALSSYIRQQDTIIRQHVAEWIQVAGKGSPTEMRQLVWAMNAETSQSVFLGPYLDDPKVRVEFGVRYRAMTDGFLAFPLKFPGTAVWRAMKGRQYVIKVLEGASARSKVAMRKGKEPGCLLDFWSQQINTEIDEADEAGMPHPKYSSDSEMAYTVMDFLFASQDASTASLIWTLAQMAEHPDILERVRQEQHTARRDLGATMGGETLADLPFTRQVVKEVLRYRPPAPMVPQIAMRPFKLSEDYTAPKDAFIIPDIVSACHQGYTNAKAFDPDRFSPERKEDVTHAGNFLVFGHGPHYCVGKEYAINHLMTFLAIASTMADWKRTRSPDSDRWKYLPTIYPWDSVFEFEAYKA